MRWWEGLPAVDAPGPEGAPDHRLRWDDGELLLTAHPDPEADEAMGALGGERCPCLDVLHAWRSSHHGGAILTVGSRHPGDTTTAPTSSIAELRADLQRWRATSGSLVEEARLSRDTHAIDRLIAVAGPAERVAARRLGFLLLLALDRTLLHRLQASVAASLAVGAAPWPQLTAATAARLLPEAARLGWSGGLAGVVLGDDAGFSDDRLVVPPAWVAEVWGRGLGGAVPGALVVGVTSVTPEGAFDVVTVTHGKAGVARGVARLGE